MGKPVLIASSLLLSLAVVAPAIAREMEPLSPVNLNELQNRVVFGRAYANLGTVTQVDPDAGVVGIAGRHGEFAIVSMSLLGWDGMRVFAPTLTVGDIKFASDIQLAQPRATLVAPQVIIRERAPG